jgi:hypothetical protein
VHGQRHALGVTAAGAAARSGCMGFSDIASRSQPYAACQRVRQFGKDIPVHLAGQNHLKAVGTRTQLGCHGVDINLAQCDVGMPRGDRARRTSRCNIGHLLEIRSGLFLSFVILPKMIKRTKPLAAEGTGTWNSVWPSRMIIAPF